VFFWKILKGDYYSMDKTPDEIESFITSQISQFASDEYLSPAQIHKERLQMQEVDATEPAFKSNGGIGDDVIESILNPGLNKTMKLAMNTSFIMLIITLVGLVILTSGDLHVISLLGI
jgi:hypothetical protein